jgi:hypothetical protein
MSSRTLLLIGVVALVLCAVSAKAGSEDLPLAERARMNGLWEAVFVDEVRVFVLDIKATGQSTAAVAVRPEPPWLAFSLSRIEAKNGEVKIHGDSPRGDALDITGRGNAYQNEGVIHAEVSLQPPVKTIGPTKWTVDFIQRPDGYIERLCALRMAAETGMQSIRSAPKKNSTDR